MVLFPVIKAEHGGHPVGITGIQGPGKGQHIGDDGDCGNAVLPYIFEHRPVEHQRDDAVDQRGGHFRAAVRDGSPKRLGPADRPDKMEQAVPVGEHQQAHDGCDGVPQAGGNRRPADPPAENGDKQVVQHDIGHAAGDGAEQGKGRLACCDHIEGEVIHQKNRDGEQQVTAQIFPAIGGDLRGQGHGAEDLPHEQIAQPAHHKAGQDIDQDQKRKVLLCFIGLSLSHLSHDSRAAACGKHGGNGRHQRDDGIDQIEGRQGAGPDQV